MKNLKKEELDDFLRQKEEEFTIPFEEKYWEQTAAYLEKNRRRVLFPFLNFRNIILITSSIVISAVGIGYYISSNKVSDSNLDSVDTKSVSSTNKTSISAANGSSNIELNTSTQSENISKSDVSTNNSATQETISVKSVSNNKSEITTSGQKNQNNSKQDIKLSSAFRKSNVSNSITNNNLNSNNLIFSSSEFIAIENIKKNFFFPVKYDSHIPVFEDMNSNDVTIPKLYGIPYPGGESNAYRSVKEKRFKSQYPQISLSLIGGFTLNQHYREDDTSSAFISPNPFIGAKFNYQWCPKFFVSTQLNVVQRGGVNQVMNDASFITTGQILKARNLYSVQLPIMIGYVATKHHLYSIGGGINYLLANGTQSYNAETKKAISNSYNIISSKGFNSLDVFASAAYTYKINRKISFTADIKYGFIDATKDAYFNQNIKHLNKSFGVSLVYTPLQKKLMR